MLVFKNLKTSIKGIEEGLLNPNDLSSKLIELADRSRQNNLRIEGIEETPNEACKDCISKYKN